MSYCKPFRRGVSWRSQNFGANATIYGPHSGNDDAAPIGTPVHAAGDGFIDWAGEFDDTYLDNLLWLLKMGGNILVLNCGANKPSFVYGHLHSFTVKRGDWVRKGQVIAYSGNTGTATTGAHLHTEAVPPGYALNSPMLGRVNPDIYLTEWPEDLGIGSLTPAGGTSTPIQEDDMFTDEDRALLRNTLNKADGGQLRADLGYQNDTLFSKADGAWQNAILADISARLGNTLNKEDGGYIVGLLEAVKPGATDAGAIAEAVVTAVGKDIAEEVIKAMGEKLAAE